MSWVLLAVIQQLRIQAHLQWKSTPLPRKVRVSRRANMVRAKEKEKMEKAKAFHPGIRIKREKEKEKIFPKENRMVLAKVRVRVQTKSWIPINVLIATSLATERPIPERCSMTKLQVVSDKFKTMVVQIKMMEVATMVHHRAMHHLLMFKTLELFPKLGHTCPMCKI